MAGARAFFPLLSLGPYRVLGSHCIHLDAAIREKTGQAIPLLKGMARGMEEVGLCRAARGLVVRREARAGGAARTAALA